MIESDSSGRETSACHLIWIYFMAPRPQTIPGEHNRTIGGTFMGSGWRGSNLGISVKFRVSEVQEHGPDRRETSPRHRERVYFVTPRPRTVPREHPQGIGGPFPRPGWWGSDPPIRVIFSMVRRPEKLPGGPRDAIQHRFGI